MRRILLLLLLCLSVPGRGAPLGVKLCVFDPPVPPLTYGNGDGQAQALLRRASRSQPLAFHVWMASREQCMGQVRSGAADAMLAVYMPERAEYAAYPMTGEQADASRAACYMPFMVWRRRGGTVGWNGHQFTDLGRQPVGTQPGLLHVALLRELGTVIDDSSSSPEQLFERLAQNHVAAIVALRSEGEQLAAGKYRGEVEMLPKPFHVTPIYLAFNKEFYRRHQAAIEAYWDAVRLARVSPEYQAYLRSYPTLAVLK